MHQPQWMSVAGELWDGCRGKVDQYSKQLVEEGRDGVSRLVEGSRDRVTKIVDGGQKIVTGGRDGVLRLELEAQLAWNKGVRATVNKSLPKDFEDFDPLRNGNIQVGSC